jgi:hypothetical protein
MSSRRIPTHATVTETLIMVDDQKPVPVFETNNRALVAVAESILDNAQIKYIVMGEYEYYNPTVQILVSKHDETLARELLSEVREGQSAAS